MTSPQTVGELPSSGLRSTAENLPGANRDRQSNLPSLSGLRWSAALLVFLYHVSVVQYFGGLSAVLVDIAFGAGDVGVSFFFVLSGFVLTWSTPTARAIPFYRRRFARIYPLHFVTALLALVLAFTLAPGTKPDLAQLIANLSLVQSWVPSVSFYQSVNPVSWSLSCEAFFYILFPLLFVLLRRIGWRGNAFVVAGCVALDLLLPMLAHHLVLSRDLNFFLYYFPPARLPEFLLGMALAQVVRAGRWRGPGVAVSLAVSAFGYFFSYCMPPEYRCVACTVIGITCLIAAVALADIKGEPSPWRSRRAVQLGELSFAFYMIHLFIMRTGEYVFRAHPHEGWFFGSIATLASFTISLTAAWLLHHSVEIPLRRLILSPPAGPTSNTSSANQAV